MNAIVLPQHTLGLIEKILNPVDMVFAFGKVRGMIDAFMLETAHIKGIVRALGIRVDNAVRLDFSGDNGHQRLRSGVVDECRVDLPLALEDAKDGHLACRSQAAFTFTFASKITFIQFNAAFKHFVALLLQMIGNHLPDFLVKNGCRIVLNVQHIGCRTGSHFKHKKFKQLSLITSL